LGGEPVELGRVARDQRDVVATGGKAAGDREPERWPGSEDGGGRHDLTVVKVEATLKIGTLRCVSTAPPLRSDARRNRERLLVAAREAFAAAGLDASLEAIAARAGVSVGTLYNHFGGRLELIDAALAPALEAAVAGAEQALGHADPWEGFAAHFTAIAELQAADRGVAALCVHSLPAESACERAKARGQELTQALVQRAQRARQLRADVTLADISLLVWAAIRATEPIRPVAPEAWRRHLAVLLDGLRAGGAHRLPGAPLDTDAVHEAMRVT
jgi:AcrR family transcriptional regulator